MNDDDDDDFFESEDGDTEEVDDQELESSAAGKRSINWRRIELLKEKMWLKQQITDYDDWKD